MDAPLLSGMFGAWSAAQFALGVFFVLAFIARRSDREYLLFGLLCFALATIDAGLSLVYAIDTVSKWPMAARVANSGAVVAAALSGHFTLTYVHKRPSPRVLFLIYAAALAFLVSNLTGRWYDPTTVRVQDSSHLGLSVRQVLASPTPLGAAFYLATVVEHAILVGITFLAYRRGKREALSMLVGLCVAFALIVNDVLVASGVIGTTYLSPYGFLIYAFTVASTLLVRYRHAAEDLEVTAGELRQATDELTSSYLELSDVQEELFRRRQLASVGELAAAIAHEVRNPLAIIRNAAANLRRPALGPEDRNTLFEIVEEEIQRLNGLVTELLRFARPVNVERSDVVLADTVAALGSSVDGEHAVRLEMADDPEVRTVWADPTLLRLALGNLVANACQATPDGGDIVISAAREEGDTTAFVRIDVRDQGAGMDATTLARATDPFFTTRPKGTGLGLPIAQRIAEAHDGTLTVESEPGRGTTVRIRLPVRRRDSIGSVETRSGAADATTPPPENAKPPRPISREHPR